MPESLFECAVLKIKGEICGHKTNLIVNGFSICKAHYESLLKPDGNVLFIEIPSFAKDYERARKYFLKEIERK